MLLKQIFIKTEFEEKLIDVIYKKDLKIYYIEKGVLKSRINNIYKSYKDFYKNERYKRLVELEY